MTTFAIRTALWGLIVAAPAVQAQQQPPPQGNPAPAPANPAFPQDTPEAAFKSLLVAMALGDEAAVRRLALPDEEFAYLLAGDHLKPEQADALRKHAEKIVLKRLKAGDEVKLPNGQVLKIAPEEVTNTRAVIVPEGGPPLPLFAYRDNADWKLDARPIIAGRKAAEAARRNAEAKKKGGN
jgi:hypothetical protein